MVFAVITANNSNHQTNVTIARELLLVSCHAPSALLVDMVNDLTTAQPVWGWCPHLTAETARVHRGIVTCLRPHSQERAGLELCIHI